MLKISRKGWGEGSEANTLAMPIWGPGSGSLEPVLMPAGRRASCNSSLGSWKWRSKLVREICPTGEFWDWVRSSGFIMWKNAGEDSQHQPQASTSMCAPPPPHTCTYPHTYNTWTHTWIPYTHTWQRKKKFFWKYQTEHENNLKPRAGAGLSPGKRQSIS